jgi:hypothetical protein
MAGLALPRPKTLQQDHRCRQPRSSLPSSKDYPCPRLRQTSPLHRTSTRSFQYPARLFRPCSSLPYMRRRMHPHTHTKSGTPTSTPTRIGNTAQTHTKNSQKCTLARRTRGALTYETVGADTSGAYCLFFFHILRDVGRRQVKVIQFQKINLLEYPVPKNQLA